MRSSTRQLWITLLFAVCLFAVYGRALSFGFVAYDDPAFIVDNPYVKEGLSTDGLKFALLYLQNGSAIHPGVMNLWHPATWISWMIDAQFQIGGSVFHLTNLLLHLSSCCLLFALLRKLGAHAYWAAVGTLLWAVHPIVVEPVVWASARKDVLSTAAALGCLVAYLKGRNEFSLWRTVSLVCMVIAVAAKPNTVILPGLLVGLDLFFIKLRRSLQWKDLWESLLAKKAYLLIAILGVVATLGLQYSGTHSEFVSSFPLQQRLALVPAQVGFYLQRLVLPFGLSIDYPFPGGLRNSVYSLAGGLVLVVLGVALRRGFTSEKQGPAVGLAALWIILAYLPVSGLAYVGTSFTADRYAYFPLIGLVLLLVLSLPASLGQRGWLRSIGAVLVLVLGAMSFFRVGVWRNTETLFTAAIENQPRSALAQGNFGVVMMKKGELDLAKEAFQRALTLNPKDYIVSRNLAEVLQRSGDREGALKSLQQSVKHHPGFARGWFALAELNYQMERFADAQQAALKASELSPVGQTQSLWLALSATERLGDRDQLRRIAARLDERKDLRTEQRRIVNNLLGR